MKLFVRVLAIAIVGVAILLFGVFITQDPAKAEYLRARDKCLADAQQISMLSTGSAAETRTRCMENALWRYQRAQAAKLPKLPEVVPADRRDGEWVIPLEGPCHAVMLVNGTWLPKFNETDRARCKAGEIQP